MENEKVRRAISLAINQDELDKITSGGLGGWSLPGVPADFFTQEQVKQVVKYDLGEAKRLLAEAGYPNGLDISLTSSIARNTGSPSAQEQLVQAQLKLAGINATMETPNTETWRSRAAWLAVAGLFGLYASLGGIFAHVVVAGAEPWWFTFALSALVFVVAVPTPIDSQRRPDLRAILEMHFGPAF